MRAVIFDMDGVLIISQPYSLKSIQTVVQEEGFEMNEEIFKRYLGMSIRDKLAAWHRDFGFPEYDVKEFCDRLVAIEYGLMRQEVKPNPHVQELLAALKRKGIKLAVATSSQGERADFILTLLGIKDYFDAIVNSDDCVKHKPDPEVFLKAAAKLGVAPEGCVVVEDAAAGIEAARRAKMKAIGILSVYHPEPFEGIPSLARIDDLTVELLEATF